MNDIDNKQVQLAYMFVEHTHKHIFLTGKAGTGKTTFLKNLKLQSPKRMIVVAPTGVAAINAGGVTIHSFFQLSFGPLVPVDAQQTGNNFNIEKQNYIAKANKFSREKINIIKSLDLLVIDEISMVRADVLDAIDEVLRRYKTRDIPFGGVQLLMIGDLQQLAPVVKEDEWKLLAPYYASPFFFSSINLQKTDYVCIELKHIYRQSDQRFIDILNKVRDGILDEHVFSELNERYIPGFDPGNDEGYITLTTHNAQAQGINEKKLEQLSPKPQKFVASIWGEFPEYMYPTEFELILKKGAQVMFVKNDPSREKLFFNGKIGIIEDIGDDAITVKCPGDYEPIRVERLEWENMRYTLDETTKEIKDEELGKFVQFPLKLAWAITIHKSQGLTFDKAIIDARSAFAHGQVYVALSRCRSLDGLVLSSSIGQHGIISNSAIIKYNEHISQNQPDDDLLATSKKQYQLALLIELFDFNTILKPLYACIKISKENQASLAGDLYKIFSNMLSQIKVDIAQVSEKFIAQLKQLSIQTPDIEQDEIIQDRILKASVYFTEKLKLQVKDIIDTTSIDSDNKVIRKSMAEAFEKLEQEVNIKLELFSFVSKGFRVRAFLNARAKAVIGDFEYTTKTSSRDKMTSSKIISHHKLYKQLKEWRTQKADNLGITELEVFKQKVLLEITNAMPCSLNDLKSVKGLSKKKAIEWGKELLELILNYRKEQNIDLPDNLIPVEEQFANEKKLNTKQQSFELFKAGKSIKEIAKERLMAETTIESHLAHFVGTGELDIFKFMTREKLDIITKYFTNASSKALTPAKEVLGEAVSYFDLKMVLKYMECKGIEIEN